jgi:protein SCO1/2
MSRSSARIRRVGLLAVTLLAACSDRAPRTPAGSAPQPPNLEGLAGPTVTPAIPKPDFVLTATDGTPFDFRKETEGKIALLFFGYTNCPDICPVHLANIAAALQKLGPEAQQAIQVVFVTTDPARDTPEVVRAWLDKFDRRFVGLTGDSAQVAAALAQLKMGGTSRAQGEKPGQYFIGHSSLVLAFTRDNLAHVVYPFGIRQADWVRDLQILAKG